MDCKQVPLDLPSLRLPLKQARRSLRLRTHINSDLVEVLQQPNDEERHLVLGEDRIGCARSVCEADWELDRSHTC